MTFSKAEEKYKTLEAHLNQDQFLLVHLNPNFNGVIVPAQFKSSPTLTLKLSYHFQGLTVLNPEKITAELLFGGKLFTCEMPLDSIWGCTTTEQKNYIWPESLSADSYSNLASEMEKIKKPTLAINKSTKEQEETVESSTKKQRPKLTRIK